MTSRPPTHRSTPAEEDTKIARSSRATRRWVIAGVVALVSSVAIVVAKTPSDRAADGVDAADPAVLVTDAASAGGDATGGADSPSDTVLDGDTGAEIDDTVDGESSAITPNAVTVVAQPIGGDPSATSTTVGDGQFPPPSPATPDTAAPPNGGTPDGAPPTSPPPTPAAPLPIGPMPNPPAAEGGPAVSLPAAPACSARVVALVADGSPRQLVQVLSRQPGSLWVGVTWADGVEIFPIISYGDVVEFNIRTGTTPMSVAVYSSPGLELPTLGCSA
jgi:hypothetical protein